MREVSFFKQVVGSQCCQGISRKGLGRKPIEAFIENQVTIEPKQQAMLVLKPQNERSNGLHILYFKTLPEQTGLGMDPKVG